MNMKSVYAVFILASVILVSGGVLDTQCKALTEGNVDLFTETYDSSVNNPKKIEQEEYSKTDTNERYFIKINGKIYEKE